MDGLCLKLHVFFCFSDSFHVLVSHSLETVLYLNLRIGRESMNHQVLSGDLTNDASAAARFRNDDPAAEEGGQVMDYRHVPLVDQDDNRLDESLAPTTQQNLMV